MTSLFKKNKKADLLLDAIIIIAALFIIAVGIVAVSIPNKLVGDSLVEEYNNTIYNQSLETAQQSRDNFAPIFDFICPFLLLVLWIASIWSSFLIDSYPIFFVIVICIMVPIFIVSLYIQIGYADFANDPSIVEYSSSFPYTIWILGHLLYIMIAFIVTGGFALYAKNKFQ